MFLFLAKACRVRILDPRPGLVASQFERLGECVANIVFIRLDLSEESQSITGLLKPTLSEIDLTQLFERIGLAWVDLEGGFEVPGGVVQISSLKEITTEADKCGGVVGIAFQISAIFLLGVIEVAILAELFGKVQSRFVQVWVSLEGGPKVLDQDRRLGGAS